MSNPYDDLLDDTKFSRGDKGGIYDDYRRRRTRCLVKNGITT